MQFTFNPISGAPVDGMPPTGLVLNYKVSQLMMIPQMNDDFQHPIVLLDDDLKVWIISLVTLSAPGSTSDVRI